MTSLSLTTVSSSQLNKEVTINTIFGQIEDRLINTIEFSINDTDPTYTMSTANAGRNYRILLSEDTGDSPTTTKTLNMANVPGMYVIENESSVTMTISPGSVSLPDGQKALVYYDGSTTKLIAIAKTTENVTMGLYHKGSPTVSEPFWGFIFTEALTLPASLTGSQFRADVAPSGGDVAFTIHKNGGASSGTITFADGSNTATVSFASGVSFAAGDRIELVAPANVYSIGEIFISFLLQRTVAA